MRTETLLDIHAQHLIMRHTTEDGYVGTLVVPTDPFSHHAYEHVNSPHGVEIHALSFPRSTLGQGDLLPYLIGMTNSARRGYRRVS